MEDNTAGARIREVRKRRGMTQRGLAEAAGLSLSAVKKIEQDTYGKLRGETARRLAVALSVPTTALDTVPDAPVASAASVQRWGPVRLALEGSYGEEPGEEPTLGGVRSVFGEVIPLLLASRFDGLGSLLPPLIRDADTLVALSADGAEVAARTLRAQIRQVAGAFMLHTWQFDAAERAFDMALEDAGDPLTAMSITEERCWGLIRQDRLADTMELALRWAGEHEPRMSASREELAAWGRLLIRASAAAVRDNRPGEAAETLRLARMAAAGTGHDFLLPYSPWHVFGPVTVLVSSAENAMIEDRPEAVLAIAARLEGARPQMPVPRFAPSHKLDVANAHAALRHDTEAVGILQQVRKERPQWLPQQRYAADILAKVIRHRRTLTAEMRELADAVRLPL